MKKRLLSLALAFIMGLSLLPVLPTAQAAELALGNAPRKSIALRTEGLREPLAQEGSTNNPHSSHDPTIYSGTYYTPSDYVWFGNYEQNGNTADGPEPIKWRVLNTGSPKDGYGTDTLIMSEYLLARSEFNEPSTDFDAWEISLARDWCKDFAGETKNGRTPAALSPAECHAVSIRNGEESGEAFGQCAAWAIRDSLKNDRVFLPSAQNVYDYVANYNYAPEIYAYYPGKKEPSPWITRTTYTGKHGSIISSRIQEVSEYGSIQPNTSQDRKYNFRPALYLNSEKSERKPDKSRIILLSAAAGGKSSDVSGLKPLQADYTGNEWKLTVVDDTRRDFSVSVSADQTITYSNAKTGEGEYLSAILVNNSSNEMTHYGHLLKLDAIDKKSGAVTIDMLGLPARGRTLYVFNEHFSGDYKTDYASPLREVQLGSEEDYLYTYATTQGEVGTCIQDPNTYDYLQGSWGTSILEKEGTELLINPESVPEGHILTGAASVTASGRKIDDWTTCTYRTADGRIFESFRASMPNEDVTITPIFDRVIDRADVRMPVYPLAGRTPADIRLSLGEDAHYTARVVQWKHGSGATMESEEAFENHQDYIATIQVTADKGYAFRGFSFPNPIPEDQKSRLFYNGKAVAEGNRDTVNPDTPVYHYGGGNHIMELTVMFAAVPTGYEVRLNANGMQGTAPAPLSRESTDPNGTTITLPMETELYDGDFEVIRWTTAPDGGESYAPGEAVALPQGSAPVTLYAQKGVLISEKNFPDPSFRAFLKGMKEGANGAFTPEELAAVKTLSCRREGVRDLTGIGYFTALQTLDCSNNALRSLDLSRNNELKKLNCASNVLQSLELGRNSNLKELDCSYNALCYLDLQHQTALMFLICSNNRLMSLSLEKQTNLESLSLNATENVRRVPDGALLANLDPSFDIRKVVKTLDGAFRDGKVVFDSGKTTMSYGCEVGRLPDGTPVIEAFSLERSDVLTFEKVSAQKLRVSVPDKNTGASLVIASYNDNGRMAGSRVYTVPGGTLAELYSLAENEKAFLLDAAGTPLCEALQG